MESASSSPSPFHRNLINQSDTPSVIIAPADYLSSLRRGSWRAAHVAAASTPDRIRSGHTAHDPEYGDHNSHYYTPNWSHLVPHQRSISRPQLVGNSVPMYATSNWAVRALFPLADERDELIASVEGSDAYAATANLVMAQLVALGMECHLHSLALTEAALDDLVVNVTRQPLLSGKKSERIVEHWFTKLNIPRAVVHVMESYPHQARIQMKACRVLSHLGKLSLIVSPKHCTSSTESVQAVLQCLKLYVDDTELAQMATAALIHMGAHFPYHESLFTPDVVRFLVSQVLRRHIKCPDIQIDTLYLFGNLSCNLALADALAVAGCIPAIIESINGNIQHAKVCEGGALALFKLSRWSQSRRLEILEQGGYSVIQQIIENHSSGPAERAARTAISALA